MKSHFDTLIDKKLAECAQAALHSPPAEPHKLAKIQGKAEAFEEARLMYRHAMRVDADAAA